MFCKHDWELLSETTTISKIETTASVYPELSGEFLPDEMFDPSKKHIQVFVCKKCGKLERFVEEI